MERIKKYTSAVLCVAIVLGCFACLKVKAITYPVKGIIIATAKIYTLAGTTGHEANAADKNKSQHIATLYNGNEIMVLGEELDGDGEKWFKIKFGSSFENSGYAYETKVELKPEYVYDQDFENSLLNFPESYRDALRSLHAKYPNWKFVADNIDLSFKQAVDLQYSPTSSDYRANKKLVELTYGGNEWRDSRALNSATGTYVEKYSNWTYASYAAIAYFVDPRNYLNDSSIFAFLQQPYDKSIQNKDGLRTVVSGTFLANGYNNDRDAYIDDIMLAAETSGVSPYVLAAAIIVEVGANGSSVTSGTYPGYEGYYNFYNWNATGSDVIGNALNYAKQQGWNTREKAIVGGAVMYAENYVSAGQDTYYYKNYNYVVEPYSGHQYAESIYGSITDSKRISKIFKTNTNGTAVFKIPVFTDMPDTASPIPCPSHIYTNDCDESCNYCGAIRSDAKHIFDNDCDTTCNICGATQASRGHLYTSECDTTCNVCASVRSITSHTHSQCFKGHNQQPFGSWELKVDSTGIYCLTLNSQYEGKFNLHNVAVFDKQGREVLYYEKSGGWPLVNGLNYTIKFRYDCSEQIGNNISWTAQKITDTVFPDTNVDEWYSDSVIYSVGSGIFSGYENGNFGVSDSIQRQDFILMLARYDGVDLASYGAKKSAFPDVAENSYYEAAVNWGSENGIVTGYINGKFGTGDKITREQIVTFLNRYAMYKDYDMSYSDDTFQNAYQTYTDYKDVSYYATDAVLWAIDKGVIKGKTPSTIDPHGNALRCEVAQIMYNIFINDIFK